MQGCYYRPAKGRKLFAVGKGTDHAADAAVAVIGPLGPEDKARSG